MLSTSKAEEAVKVSIQRPLHMAILKVQVDNNADWDVACTKAAELIDVNSEKFKKAVQREAQRFYKSRHMNELNKARQAIAEEAAATVQFTQDNFRIPCSKCGEFMYFSSDDDWESKEKPILYEAFKGWSHGDCIKDRIEIPIKKAEETIHIDDFN